MFQGIVDEDIKKDNEEFEKEENSKRINFKNFFSISNIILYTISFMVSMVSFGGKFAPFGLAIFAAACSNGIPAIIIYVITLIGTLVGFGVSEFLNYFLTSLVFIVSILLFRTKYEYKDRNEKLKLGKHVLISTLVVNLAKMFFGIFLVYDLLSSISFSIISYIFYKIFTNSITVIKDYGKKQAFTIEEVIGASLILSIALYSLHGLNVFGLSISNILSIMLVLFLGWKYGMLVGATSGITIGMVIGIIGDQGIVLIAAYAISRNGGRNIK